MNIRSYKSSDFDFVSNWWKTSTGDITPNNLMIENGTFILEIGSVPALCVTVLLTQTKEIAYIFGYIKNPIFKKVNLEDYGQLLWDHCYNFAKENGYKRVLCFSDNEKLQKKYMRFGMKPTLNNLMSFVREI